MGLRNTTETYGSMAKTIHWLIFLMVTTLLIVGFFMGDIEKPLRYTIYNIHKLAGITVLTIMIFRVYWTITNPKLSYSAELPAWQILAARTVHYILYALVILMPLSGWIMSTAAGHNPLLFGTSLTLPFIPESKPLAKFFHKTHTVMAWTIIAMVSLHVLAALKHHFVNKDNVLKRMLPGQ